MINFNDTGNWSLPALQVYVLFTARSYLQEARGLTDIGLGEEHVLSCLPLIGQQLLLY